MTVETGRFQKGLGELCDHIEATHHRYLREELPRLSAFVEKVSMVHGERHPDLLEVKAVYDELSRELLSQLAEEEQVLFPMIRSLAAAGTGSSTGSVATPIRRTAEAHERVEHALERLRRLTDGYTPPADACGSYRAMLIGLAALENDLQTHIQKESGALFPRAIEMEKRNAVSGGVEDGEHSVVKADPEKTVREIIEAHPQTEDYFADLGVDDCCEQFTLREISRLYKVELDDMIRRIESLT